MAYRSLFTAILAQSGTDDALDQAIECAHLWDAYLNVICTDQRMPVVTGAWAGDMGIAYAPVMDFPREELKQAETRVRDRLASETIGWSVHSIDQIYEPEFSQMTRTARFSDLALLPIRGKGIDTSQDNRLLESLLFATSLPILALPKDARPNFPRVTIAWDQSDIALKAVRRAMPLLKKAEKVDIVVVDPPHAEADVADPGQDLAQYLSRHGIAADVAMLAKSRPRVADCILRQVSDTASALVVMGAYGHSPLREKVLGGVTRDMINAAAVPMLLAH